MIKVNNLVANLLQLSSTITALVIYILSKTLSSIFSLKFCFPIMHPSKILIKNLQRSTFIENFIKYSITDRKNISFDKIYPSVRSLSSSFTKVCIFFEQSLEMSVKEIN